MENIDREQVLRIVKMRGPIIPNELRKTLGQGDTMLLGAMLSELSSKGLVRISKTKIGGSPFYYDPARPESLERVSEHLGEKDRRTYALLKEKKVLRDDAQEALTRVSLRNIKDYARMLQVNAPEGTVVYWKYYLVPDAEAEPLIKEDLGMTKAKPEPAAVPEPAKPDEAKAPPTPAEAPAAPASSTQSGSPHQTPDMKEKGVKEEKKEKVEGKKAAEEQQELPKELERIDDPFYERIRTYFDEHEIAVKEQTLVRKRSELDFIILLPTPMGRVEYYCKAKAKKRSNDGDLAAAKLQGNGINLPVIYLTTGEITKKAKEKLQHEFKGLVVKEL